MLVLWKCPSIAQRWDITKGLKQIIQIQFDISKLVNCFSMNICTISKIFFWKKLFTKFNYWLKQNIYHIFVPALRTLPILQKSHYWRFFNPKNEHIFPFPLSKHERMLRSWHHFSHFILLNHWWDFDAFWD